MNRQGIDAAQHPDFASFSEQSLALALFRLSKPGIVLAEIMAGLAGMLLSVNGQPLATINFPVLLAIALAASGAAMLNGIFDFPYDRHMPRLTLRYRALEAAGSGRVLTVAIILMTGGLAIAALAASLLTLLLLAGGSVAYLLLYTFWLKRRTPWGVLAGCIPGALPPLIGAAASSGTMSTAPLLLATLIFIWQLPHFWLLALEYRNQYAQAKIPVLPLTHGDAVTKALTLTAAVLLMPITLTLGIAGSLSHEFIAVTCLAGFIFTLYCGRALYFTRKYHRGFMASLWYLMFIIFAICLEQLHQMADYFNW